VPRAKPSPTDDAAKKATKGVENVWRVRRQADVAVFFGVSIDTVKNWAKQQMPGAPGNYDLAEILRWLRASGPWKAKPVIPPGADELLVAEGDSPGLERYRLAKAALAELELEERKGALLSREKARLALNRWASIIRRLGERFGKRYGREAAMALNDAITECQHVVDHEFVDSVDGGEPADELSEE
jgi:phage terminase Nu1 subunit (DNA packaging protein)